MRFSFPSFTCPASETRVPAADGLRALCTLGIMWYHIWQQSWLEPSGKVLGVSINCNYLVRSGYLLVDAMLMLSGFLLFLPYARAALSGEKSPGLAGYYQKRAARILPSYYLCVLSLFFFFALPRGLYASAPAMWRDLLSHLTLTQVFSADTYIYTQLNVVLWTVAVEAQFYLIFPFLARGFQKRPLAAYLLMVGAALGFRAYAASRPGDLSLWINQLPAMLDVYANGMLAAFAYVALARTVKENAALQAAFTLGAVLCLVSAHALFQAQTGESGYEALRLGQMARRYPLSLLFALFLLCAGHALRPVQWLLGNRLMRFLSAISYQMYIWHHFLALRLKEWRIPSYAAEANPQMFSEPVWQRRYTLLCFALSIALGALLTYLFEKPAAKALLRARVRKERGKPAPD